MSRLDRTGEPLDTDGPLDTMGDPQPPLEEHHCHDGWVLPDSDHPAPCLICKPWLAGRHTMTGTTPRKATVTNLDTREL